MLEIRDGNALVISEYLLDATVYYYDMADVTWEKSSLRNWLNSKFYDTAFSESEKSMILTVKIENKDNPLYGTPGGNDTEDNVFCLSLEEAQQYFKDADERKAAPTDYAVMKGYSFIQVKTVRSGMYPDYDITNEFYKSLGFKELEVLEEYWDAANPCQIYVMGLKSAVNVIGTRHSYRGKVSSDPVPRKDLEIIANAGIDAPSGCNKQTTDLVVVDDPKLLDELKGVIDPPVAQTAPAMIVVLSRKINAYRDRCFAIQDYSAAIENMLLAIVELGYQSCWYEGHITDDDRICDKIAAVLGVPDEYDVVCILPVGKALDDFHAPSKRSFAERVMFNGFGKE